MSTLATTTSSSSSMELPKRKRKRTRTRKTKGGDGDAEDGEEQEQQEMPAVAAVQSEVKQGSIPSASTGSEQGVDTSASTSRPDTDIPPPKEEIEKKKDEEDNDDDDEEGGDDDALGKKKRKRNRKRSKKGGDQTTPASSNTAAASSTESTSLSQALSTNPITNPEQDEELPSEGAKQAALTYAYTHNTSRSTWKFQKAKEAWLQRHLLTVPLSSETGQQSETGRTDTISGDPSSEETQPTVDNSIPDKYLPLVVNYLSTMQGKAKDRLIGELRNVIASMKALPSEEEQLQENANQVPAAPTSSGAKSVSFADVADEQNRKDEGLTTLSEERKQRDEIRWKGHRAERVLQWLS
ncbi:unnamed protein product [Sympodiomycopsis kandeliae]